MAAPAWWKPYILQQAKARGYDPLAVLSVASAEGLSGGVGDGGHAFGPFQLNNAGGVLTNRPGNHRQFAESKQGINWALDQMGFARGLQGKAAINAIVRRFERPADPNGEVTRAWNYYAGNRGRPQNIPRGTREAKRTLTTFGTGDDRREAILDFASKGLSAFVSGGEQPSAIDLITRLRAQAQVSPFEATSEGKLAAPMPGKGTQGKALRGAAGMLRIIQQARNMGLHVAENPYVDRVDPVHTQGSDHYKVYPGGKVGKGLDVSGNPAQLRAFFMWAAQNAGNYGVNDLFYDPMKWSLDRGRRWNQIIGGHPDHAHVSTF
jgi:hypothetical protein